MKKVLIGLVVVIGVLVAVIASRPDSFRVERSTVVNAPAEVAYDYLNDFHHWGEWAPWEKLDPNMKKTYDGAPKGIGAKYAWKGNKDVGEGEMQIIGVRPNEMVKMSLHFITPFEAKNETTFALEPKGDQTTVRWIMEGPSNFMMKAFSLFMNMDKQVGGDFEAGLAKLKPILEAEGQKRIAEAKAAAEKAAAEKAAADAAAGGAPEGQPAAAPN